MKEPELKVVFERHSTVDVREPTHPSGKLSIGKVAYVVWTAFLLSHLNHMSQILSVDVLAGTFVFCMAVPLIIVTVLQVFFQWIRQ